MKYIHLRYADPYNHLAVSNMGGVTIAYDLSSPPTPEGDRELKIGIAVCSECDNFCRETGRTKAKARLLGLARLWSHQELLTKAESDSLTDADIVLLCCDMWPQYFETWRAEWEDVQELDELFNVAKEHATHHVKKADKIATCDLAPGS